ncbi:DASS family sodium-coupled anion symporter [Bacteriovoracaceae bacterium]|nr:DASS family sodium-coupled anion symporter [Bacteriovoracaceae bacterium]
MKVISMIICPLILVQFVDISSPMALALFISIVLLWFTEVIPLPITGLMVPCLSISYGLLSTKEAFTPFGNQILFLFIGSFLLAKSMEKHGWDKRMAYFFLTRKIGPRSLNGIIFFIGIICWGLSMWISNTAACAIMVPIALGLMNSLDTTDPETMKSFQTKILLTCAFASSIGGVATPVGSPPNMLALQFLQQEGIEITFFKWMQLALPLSLMMFAALYFILNKLFPIKDEATHTRSLYDVFSEKYKNLGPMKLSEKQITFCFLLAVFFWITPGLFKTIAPTSELSKFLSARFSMGMVALSSALILFFVKDREGNYNLTWQEGQDIDWGTIFIFGGGLCLGTMLDKTGLATEIGTSLFNFQSGGSIILPTIIIIATGIILSEFSSNTASAALLIPLILGATQGSGLTTSVATQLTMAAALGASFGFMLPVSTPPNAIVYGTGKLKLKDMIKSGIIFDFSGLLLIFIFSILIFPLLL